MKRDTRHVPVLLNAVLDILNPHPGQIIVDCTLGLGGHSAAILERIAPTGRLIAIDFDPANIALARETLAKIGGTFELHHNNFAALPTVLAQAGVDKVDARAGRPRRGKPADRRSLARFFLPPARPAGHANGPHAWQLRRRDHQSNPTK